MFPKPLEVVLPASPGVLLEPKVSRFPAKWLPSPVKPVGWLPVLVPEDNPEDWPVVPECKPDVAPTVLSELTVSSCLLPDLRTLTPNGWSSRTNLQDILDLFHICSSQVSIENENVLYSFTLIQVLVLFRFEVRIYEKGTSELGNKKI